MTVLDCFAKWLMENGNDEVYFMVPSAGFMLAFGALGNCVIPNRLAAGIAFSPGWHCRGGSIGTGECHHLSPRSDVAGYLRHFSVTPKRLG